MVFDVDKLKEALQFDSPNTAERQIVHDAARMVAAGQPLWWCEEHDRPGLNTNHCLHGWTRTKGDFCRMVEGWWMPTGDSE